jgi:hypothetical protein
MKLISCPQCCAVFNGDKFIFPAIFDREEGFFIHENAYWDGEKYVSAVDCPVCGGKIYEENEPCKYE